MIVVIFLPKSHASFLPIVIRRFLFKAFCEREQITGWRFPKHQEMDVVGHDAVGVYKKLVKNRFARSQQSRPLYRR
jgi:hypothetical protein